jgi:hypothetical protein
MAQEEDDEDVEVLQPMHDLQPQPPPPVPRERPRCQPLSGRRDQVPETVTDEVAAEDDSYRTWISCRVL